MLDEEARPQRRNRSRRRRNRGNRPEGGSTSRDRQPGESCESVFYLLAFPLQNEETYCGFDCYQVDRWLTWMSLVFIVW